MQKKQLRINMKLEKARCISGLFLLKPDTHVAFVTRMMLKYVYVISYVYFSRIRPKLTQTIALIRAYVFPCSVGAAKHGAVDIPT